MPGVPPDAMEQVKRGLKSILHRKSRKSRESSHDSVEKPGPSEHKVFSGSGNAPEEVSGPNPVFAPPPQLTTSIPGASLGTDGSSSGRTKEETTDSQSHLQPVVVEKPWAEGMSATSGPLGMSLEEVEEYERSLQRRPSAMTEEERTAANTAGNASEHQRQDKITTEAAGGEQSSTNVQREDLTQPAIGSTVGKTETTGDLPAKNADTAEEGSEHTPDEGQVLAKPTQAEEEV